VNLTTNAGGSIGAWVYPDMLTAAGNLSGTFMTILNDVTFNPVTGVQTPASTYVKGPLNSLAAGLGVPNAI